MLTPSLTDEEISSTTEIGTTQESARPPAPFLPFACDLPHERKSAQRFQVGDSGENSDTVDNRYPSGDLEDAVVFAGTGLDVRRVLKRAMRSHLYGRKRAASAIADLEEIETMYDGEEPFRILVIGGSGEPGSLLTTVLFGLLIPWSRTCSLKLSRRRRRDSLLSLEGPALVPRRPADGRRPGLGTIRV